MVLKLKFINKPVCGKFKTCLAFLKIFIITPFLHYGIYHIILSITFLCQAIDHKWNSNRLSCVVYCAIANCLYLGMYFFGKNVVLVGVPEVIPAQNTPAEAAVRMDDSSMVHSLADSIGIPRE